MTRNILLVTLSLVLVGTLGWMVAQKGTVASKNENSNGILATIYKSPLCSCCGKWGNYMEGEGYTVTTKKEDDMSLIKQRFQVPYELESCHTAIIEGYVVEGHIPNEAIEKLLEERPDIQGIGMAGMPSGSPGMPGVKEDFMIYEINHDGTKGDLFIKL